MKYKFVFFTLIIFLFCIKLNAQFGKWKNHTQMIYINKIAVTDSGLWMATKGGAFYYSLINGSYEKFTSTEGLKSVNLTAVSVDKYGRVWLGAADGNINIYNPYTKQWNYIVVIFNSQKTSKKINEIKTTDSVAYISSDAGISLIGINDLQFGDTYANLGSLGSDTKVNSIFLEDTLWAATENGIAVQKSKKINYLSPDSWTSFTSTQGLNSNFINSIVRYKDTVYAGTSLGVSYFDKTGFVNKFASLNKSEIIKLVPKGDSLIIATRNYIYGYIKGNLELLYDFQKYGFYDLICSKTMKDIYSGTSNGVLKVLTDNNTYLNPPGPNSNLFPSMVVDDNSGFWAASGRDPVSKGFYQLKDSVWKNFLTNDYPVLGSNNYHKMAKSSGNIIWALSWGNGITKIANDTPVYRYDTKNTGLVGISANASYIVCNGAAEDSKGNMWFLNYAAGNQKILAKLTPENNWEFFSNEYNPNAINVNNIVIDNYDTKFIVQEDGGIHYFNENGILSKKWGYLSDQNGLNSNTVNCLVIDKQGDLWMGNKIGANVIYNTQKPESQIISVYALRNQFVNCMTVDGLNNKWVGTLNGVWVLSSDGSTVLEQFNTKNCPILSDDIKSITIDNKTGTVYFGTESGLSTYRSNSVEPKEEYEKLNVYPNPFKIGKHLQIVVDGLIENSNLKILAVDGKLIRSIITPGGRIGYWDGKDDKNNFVESGVYFIVAHSQDGKKSIVGKVAVLKQ